jgi:hypothetical protein
MGPTLLHAVRGLLAGLGANGGSESAGLAQGRLLIESSKMGNIDQHVLVANAHVGRIIAYP